MGIKKLMISVTTKITLCSLLVIYLTGCNSKIASYDDTCQEGWAKYTDLSQRAFNILEGREFIRYIALKGGNEQGSYDFSFMGQDKNGAIFVHAGSPSEFKLKEISSAQADRAFSTLLDSGEYKAIEDYTGNEDDITNLSCQYLKIKTDSDMFTASFRYHILMMVQEPVEHKGVKALVVINNYFYQEFIDQLKTQAGILDDKNNNEIISKEKISILSRNNADELFYEIP
jgi:hypothetical protein